MKLTDDLSVKIEDLDDLFKKGYNYYWEGDYQTAYKYFDKSIKKEGGHYLKSYYKGQALYNQGKLTDSLTFFTEALKKKQDFIECQIKLATVYQKLGKSEKALQEYNDALNNRPTIDERIEIIQHKVKLIDSLKKQKVKIDFENNFEEGMWNYLEGYTPYAAGRFEAQIKDNPEHSLAYLYCAIANCKSNDLDIALECINKFIKFEPNYAKAWYVKAKILERKREYQLAIDSCEKALELNPNSTLFRDYISRIYRLKPKSITPKLDILPIEEKNKEIPPLFGIALALYTTKKSYLEKDKTLIKALDYFRINDYIMLQIDFMSLYYGIANQFKIDEPLKETIELALRLLGITRKTPEAFNYFNKALGYISKSNITKGLELLEKAIIICPDNPMYSLELYKIHQQIGNIKKASDIRKKFEKRVNQLKNKEYQQEEFERLKTRFNKDISFFNDLKKIYNNYVSSDKGSMDFLNSIISEIAKYLKGDSNKVNKNNISKIIDDCLVCLELFSLIASLVYFKLQDNFVDAQTVNKIKTAIIDILGWEPEPLPSIQYPNFLSPSLRKKNWQTFLGMDILSGQMMNSIQEARYFHMDGDLENDDPKSHAWYSKKTADQVSISEQSVFHDKTEGEHVLEHVENLSLNDLSQEENIKDLERKFEKSRVYGDERDLEIFEIKKNPNGPNCEVYIRAPYLYPELKNDPRNRTLLKPECVETALVEFIKYKFRNWTKVVLYRRIEDRVIDDFDRSNSCAVPLSTYTELINARRTNPTKAREQALRIVKNIQLIEDFKFGKISEQAFKREMLKRKEEYAQSKDIPRSRAQLKKDNELILNHIERYIGKIEKSIHDQRFELAPLSIHIIPKTHDQKYSALVTSGLSFLPMSPPNPMKFFRYSELIIKLPLDWPLPIDILKKDDFIWPIEQLNILMKYVHMNHQWFFDMHTFGNGNPPDPFANNTKLCGFLFILPVLSFPPEFCELKIDDSKLVIFLQLIPLYKEEMDYAVTEGSEALLKKFEEIGIPDHVDIHRKNLFGSRKLTLKPTKTAGYFCPFCNTVLRNFKPKGIFYRKRCPSCNRFIVEGRDGKLISLDIPDEKPSIPKKNKEKAERLYIEGLKFFKQLKGEKALSTIDKALKLNPYDKRTWSLKVQLLNKLGRFVEAKECAEKAMKFILRNDV